MITSLYINRTQGPLYGNISGNIGGLEIPLYSIDNGPYHILNIDGLTPVPMEYEARVQQGTSHNQFYNPRHGLRQIILTIGFNEYFESIYTLRTRLYDHMLTGYMTRLTFTMSDGEEYYIEGIVKHHESNVFGEEPMTQITLECEDPYFKGTEPVFIERTGVPSGTDVLGTLNENHLGNAPTGVFIQLVPSTTPRNVPHSIKFVSSHASSRLVQLGEMHIDDMLNQSLSYRFTLDTRPGQRDVALYRTTGDKYSDLVGGLRSGYRWLTIYPQGNNRLHVHYYLANGTVIPLADNTIQITIPKLMVGI